MLAKGLERVEPSAHRRSLGARRTLAVASVALVTVVLLAAGAASTSARASTTASASPMASASPSAAVGQQLTIAYPYAANVGLNPALGPWPVDDMAYDGLTYVKPSGKIVPALATSWKYVGKARRDFVITLRKGVRFSDGSRLTSQVLKNSFEYFQATKGAWSSLATYDSIKVLGPLTVDLHLTQPNPLMPLAISQQYDVGAPICPAFLADPAKLVGQTCGAGPYVLDNANSIPGNLYVENANPYYWNKSAVHYRKIVFKIIGDPTSTLAALETGQVDVALGDGSTVGAAEKAGLTVKGGQDIMYGVQIQDANGTLLKPLASLYVRQALNYAIDRRAITKVVNPTPGVAFPTDQPFTPAEEMWNRSMVNRYPYNPEKAKALLKAAGYPNGFTFPVLTSPLDNELSVGLAIEKYWEAIGVHMALDNISSPAEVSSKTKSATIPAYTIDFGTHPAFILWGAWLSPNGTNGRNAFHLSDPKLNAWATEAASAPTKRGNQLWAQIGKRITNLAWFVPVFNVDYGPIYARKTVAGVNPTPKVPVLDFRNLFPSGR